MIFVTLPHYSTDRLWLAAFQANLSMGLYFASLYSGLEAAIRSKRAPWWRALSIVACAASVFAYEVVAPLFLLNPFLEIRQRRYRDSRPVVRLRNALPSLTITIVVLGLAFLYKSAHSNRVVIDRTYGSHIWWLIGESLTMNYVELGLDLPQKLVLILREYLTRSAVAVAVALGAVVFISCLHTTSSSSFATIKRSSWLALTLLGLMLSLCGYLTFLTTAHVAFTASGINNRTAIAAALGVALAFTGISGLASTLLRAPGSRHRFFALATALFCMSGSLINTTIAMFWTEASREQRAVINSIRSEFPSLPARTTLLLDGLCRYRGPGIIFETHWDVGGMLQVYYRDPSLSGDVITARTAVHKAGVSTGIYGDTTDYDFSDKLLVYDVRRKGQQQLPDHDTALDYFAQPGRIGARCPDGVEGFGAPVF
jgi:hypothetical protein